MLRLTRTPDAVLIKSYVDNAESLDVVPKHINLPVAIGWLCKEQLIEPDSCQDVFDALFGKGKLDVADVVDLPEAPKKKATKKAAAKKAET